MKIDKADIIEAPEVSSDGPKKIDKADIVPLDTQGVQNEEVPPWGVEHPDLYAGVKTAENIVGDFVPEKREDIAGTLAGMVASSIFKEGKWAKTAFPLMYEGVKQGVRGINREMGEPEGPKKPWDKEMVDAFSEIGKLFLLDKGLHKSAELKSAMEEAISSKSIEPLKQLLKETTDPFRSKAANLLDSAGKAIYRGTFKPATTLSPKKRERIIDLAMKHNLEFSDVGYEEIKKERVSKTLDENKKIIDSQLADEAINHGKVIDEVSNLAESYEGKNMVDWDRQKEETLSALSVFANDFGKHTRITLPMAQRYKENIYKYIGDHYGELSSPKIEGFKKIAKVLSQEIEDKAAAADRFNAGYGQETHFADIIKKNNKTASEFLEIQGAYARATGRIQNVGHPNLMTGIGMEIAAEGNIPLGIAVAVSRLPGTRNYAAQKLYRAGQRVAPDPVTQKALGIPVPIGATTGIREAVGEQKNALSDRESGKYHHKATSRRAMYEQQIREAEEAARAAY